MNPLELLNTTHQSDELKRTISTAAVLWALSSAAVLLMSKLGWIASYESALPFVVLTAWLGAEIAARIPGRIPIAVCEKCERIQVLPKTPFRRYWPWKRCTVCGGNLNYACPNNHLLSLFLNEDISSSESIWCSHCGLPSRTLSEEEFLKHLKLLSSRKPEEMDNRKLAPPIWRMIRGTELGDKLRAVMSEVAQEYKAANQQPTRVFKFDDLESLKPPDPNNLFWGED
jgi:hypothetical protein